MQGVPSGEVSISYICVWEGYEIETSPEGVGSGCGFLMQRLFPYKVPSEIIH